jgi:hydrogenase maturation protease
VASLQAGDQLREQESPIGRAPIRILCLGNDILSDDALGSAVAERLREFVPEGVEVVSTTDTGFYLFDYVSNTSCLIVIDTVVTGASAPGTIYVLGENDIRTAQGGSPHYIGLQETLALVRALNFQVPETVVVLAVEAADCLTLGGPMHPAVSAAIPVLLEKVRETIATQKLPCSATMQPS